MRRTFGLLLILLVAGSLVGLTACGGSSGEGTPAEEAGGGDQGNETQQPADDEAAGEPILVGITAAQTGIMTSYDYQAVQLLQMRLDEINKSGGVLGRPLTTKWMDSKSEQELGGTNAEELMNEGAAVIITTCDFDYSLPAITAAQAQEIPAVSLCASSPKVATPAIVGPYAGSMGPGGDSEGTAMAEWLRAKRPELLRAYILKDTSIEYPKSTSDYFKARWLELGGEICGEDTFVGGPNLDLSSQITRLRGKAAECDVIFDGSWQPYTSQALRAIRDAGLDTWVVTNASASDLITEIGGNVSNFLALGIACLPSYCNGTQTPEIVTISKEFEKKYGEPIKSHYALPGYRLADVIVAAIEKAGTTEGPAIADALFTSGLTFDYFGTEMSFTDACHRPQPAAYSVEEWKDGIDTQIDTVVVQSIPDIGDGNSCAGNLAAIGE